MALQGLPLKRCLLCVPVLRGIFISLPPCPDVLFPPQSFSQSTSMFSKVGGFNRFPPTPAAPSQLKGCMQCSHWALKQPLLILCTRFPTPHGGTLLSALVFSLPCCTLPSMPFSLGKKRGEILTLQCSKRIQVRFQFFLIWGGGDGT